MKLDIDGHAVTLTCPSCGKKFDEKIGRLKHDPTLTCPGCLQPVRIEAEQLRRGIQSVQESLNKLTRTLGKIGK